MAVEIINIEKAHESILFFLYPTYSWIDDGSLGIQRYITKRDIKTNREKEVVQLNSSDCVIISNRLYNEFWTEDVLKAKVVEFMRTKLQSRRKKFPESKEGEFVDVAKEFMFSSSTEEGEDNAIFSLFETYGSGAFIPAYLTMIETTPVQVVVSAMMTFISRLLDKDSTSIFYKKMHQKLAQKVSNNFTTSYCNYMNRPVDSEGLSQLKFLLDIVK